MRGPLAGATAFLFAAGVLLVGALALRAAVWGPASDSELVVVALTGVGVPLVLIMLEQRPRRRITAAVLALSVGLGINVLFLANAVPAAAVTDNSSIFTFTRSTGFASPNLDMLQNYSPTGASTTCPAAGYNWTCSWTSDTFSTGQSLPAGTAQVDLYLANDPVPVLRSVSLTSGTSNNVCAMTKPASLADGDVMLAACAFRGGTATTVTSVPSGWSLVGTRVDNGTTLSLVVYSHVVATASSEPASYTWDLSAVEKLNWSIVAYSGVDPLTPIDAEGGAATASDTSHAAPSVSTTVSNDMLVTYHATGICTPWTPPVGMTERADGTFCSQSVTSNVDMETNDLLLGAAGATGPHVATNTDAAEGATKTVALRRNTAPLSCDLTVQLSRPILYRSSESNVAEASTSIAVNRPAGVLDGDVMVASLGYTWTTGVVVTAPAGWTLVRDAINGAGIGVSVWVTAASAEPASYTWSISAASQLVGEISAYSGVDIASPVDVSAASTGFETMPSLTTSQPGEMLVASFGGLTTAGAATWTPPAGMTERVDRSTTTASWLSLAQDDQKWVMAGPTGSRTTNSTPGVNGPAGQWMALRPAAGSVLGSGTASIVSPGGPTLVSVSFATPAVTFADGDRLQVDVLAPNDPGTCGASVSYDGAAEPSKLTVATNVPEGVAGLLMLAPALPFALRRWRRGRL